MSFADLEGRPSKKRRFFVEESPEDATLTLESTLPDEINSPRHVESNTTGSGSRPDQGAGRNSIHAEQGNSDTPSNAFDVDLFVSIVGENVSNEAVEKLQQMCGNDVQQGTQMPGQL